MRFDWCVAKIGIKFATCKCKRYKYVAKTRLEGSFENSENFSLNRCKLLIISIFILRFSEFCCVKLLSDAKSFLSGMSWNGFTDFKQECVTNWTKLFATNEVQFTDNAIDNFLAFVDHMSCSADTYVSLGGSNGCADQLTNWDGTQKLGLGIFYKEKKKSQSR